MKFLIADDEEDLREILSIMINSNYDVNIYNAADGQEAISMIQNEGPFDLVICDFNMPKKNGSDVYNELRKLNAKTPFVLLSTDFPNFKKHNPEATFVEWIDKPFTEDDITKKIEAVIAQKDLPTQKDSYLAVSLESLEKIEAAGVSLYLKLNQSQYIKVLKENAIFDKKEVARFKSKKLTHLYVELIDTKTFISNYRKNIFSRLDWNNVDANEAVQNLETDWSLILEGTRNFGWSESLIQFAKENIAKTLTLIGRAPQLKKFFERIKKNSGKNNSTSHCYSLVFLLTAILKELEWDSPSTIQKLTFAALLHDMELNELMYTNKQQLIESNKLLSEIHQPANYLIFNHMNTAAEFVSRWTSCPADVDKIILQHHERLDGTGFPNKLTFLTLYPLAGVFIIAEDLLYHNLHHPEVPMLDYLKQHESYYNKGDFKKIYNATVKVAQEQLAT